MSTAAQCTSQEMTDDVVYYLNHLIASLPHGVEGMTTEGKREYAKWIKYRVCAHTRIVETQCLDCGYMWSGLLRKPRPR